MDELVFQQLNERLERLERKVDLLLEFKWKTEGKQFVFSAIIAAVVSIAVAFISRS